MSTGGKKRRHVSMMKEPEREESEEEYVNESDDDDYDEDYDDEEEEEEEEAETENNNKKNKKKSRDIAAEMATPHDALAFRKETRFGFELLLFKKKKGTKIPQFIPRSYVSKTGTYFIVPKKRNSIAQLKNFNKRLGKYIRQLEFTPPDEKCPFFRRELFLDGKEVQINDISMRNVCDEKQDTSFSASDPWMASSVGNASSSDEE